MSETIFLITILAKDRPGIVKTLSDVILSHHGSWQESSLSQLCGQFAGIVNIAVAEDRRAALEQSLRQLEAEGFRIHFPPQEKSHLSLAAATKIITIEVEANDRDGIVDEIASALATQSINIVKMDTQGESASMAGYNLFKATIKAALPPAVSEHDLEQALEQVSDDLMVSIAT